MNKIRDRREYNAAYYLANRRNCLEYQSAYNKTHKEQKRAYDRSRTKENAAYNAKRIRTPRARFSALQRAALSRGLPFNLTVVQHQALIAGGACCYCNGPLPTTVGGLDRKNSYLGYSEENCVPCCRRCNELRGKDNISYSEMFEVIKLLRKLRTKADAGDDSEEYF